MSDHMPEADRQEGGWGVIAMSDYDPLTKRLASEHAFGIVLQERSTIERDDTDFIFFDRWDLNSCPKGWQSDVNERLRRLLRKTKDFH